MCANVSPDGIDRFLWIDVETTGLDELRCELLEVAALVTDSQLREIDEGVDIVIHAPQSSLEQMPRVVKDMHTTSGLIGEVQQSSVSLREAERAVLDYMDRHFGSEEKVIMAGNSITLDRNFLRRFMPQVDEHLHYRMIDVSTLKELMRLWSPGGFANVPQKVFAHRALGDIRESIDELRFYRKYFLTVES